MVNINQININKYQKIAKYILMGIVVILALKYIPDTCLPTKEILMIGATSSLTFAILDMVSPNIIINPPKSEVLSGKPKNILVENI